MSNEQKAYGVGMMPEWSMWPSPSPIEPQDPAPCFCTLCMAEAGVPYISALHPWLVEAEEAVLLALKEQQEAERAHAEASIAVETAKAKHRAAVEHLVKVASGQVDGGGR